MGAFLAQQFSRGGRMLGEDTLQAIFALAGDSPSDQQQFSYHLWTQSNAPDHIGLPELRRAFAALHGGKSAGEAKSYWTLQDSRPASRVARRSP